MSSNKRNVYIVGIGIISPLGYGLDDTEQALRKNESAIAPLHVFSIQQPPPLPVGQVQNLPDLTTFPRTHRLAITAARQAMEGCTHPPDAVIIGSTTGGILTTEELLAAQDQDAHNYRYHGLTTVAEEIAREVQCSGQALTVSTACSSGTVAISMALKMLQSGKAEWILAGGVDSLCHLTYFGFHSLQLVDPRGSRPFDKNRQGMSVAEGAAMLLLSTTKPQKPLGQILGCGLSCDAYHPASPHPEGKGASRAMQKALDNAALKAAAIDYINLHGTGTPENDRAESKAVRSIFPQPPPLSSIKGATGHGLAASGAIEAAIAAICLQKGFVPANTGCRQPDPECQLTPILQPADLPIATVLSNSFGFGGNNACLIIAQPDLFSSPEPAVQSTPLTLLGKACITGAGHTQKSMERFSHRETMAGVIDLETISAQLPVRKVRRLKRFSRIALALADAARKDSGLDHSPHCVFMGSGWGSLSETYDFLDKLHQSQEQFPSPIDFVGSVHNSAAGQIAIMHEATGANITSSGGDYSFEQALLAADTFLDRDDSSNSAFVLAADEAHTQFSSLLDPSIEPATPLADGGGCLSLCRQAMPGKLSMQLTFFRKKTTQVIDELITASGGKETLQRSCRMILAGIPAAEAKEGQAQLDSFLEKSGLTIPVIHYREFTGEFASASAVAAVMAVHLMESSEIPAGEKILVLGFGMNVTCMEFGRQ
ncbi:MAG: beta-ketoacyl-[acyl-carrier-protein] synthase family protein [Desulfocapsaceae bacterium]|nr:beta-ketoacyl-[acyl-carrier-protein] synthase family protein [Desulfocapsaceae bacterium]